MRYILLILAGLIPMTVTSTLGSFTFPSLSGTPIGYFWPAAAFQAVLSIWFGVYGTIVGTIGPMIGNGLVGGLMGNGDYFSSSLLFVPANFLQSALPGLIFRWWKLDPRLRNWRDWTGLIFIACIGANVLGACLGIGESVIRDMAAGDTIQHGMLAGKFVTWVAGNSLPAIILAPLLLKAASGMLVRGPLFCQTFFGGVNFETNIKLRGFDDLPIIAKLTSLTMLVGIIPLSIVAGMVLWNTMDDAEAMAADINHDSALKIRNFIERHSLLLQLWANKMAPTAAGSPQREAMKKKMDELAEGFNDIVDEPRQQAMKKIPPNLHKAMNEYGMIFFSMEGASPQERDLYGAANIGNGEYILMGKVVGRDDKSVASQWQEAVITQRKAEFGIIAYAPDGQEVHRGAPPAMADWQPDLRDDTPSSYKVKHGGRTWLVAETYIPNLKWRFIVITSTQAGTAAILSNVSGTMTILINVIIFGSLLIGCVIASRIGHRVLAIANQVLAAQGQPTSLNIVIRGNDEIGFLGQSLNDMSSKLEQSVAQLQQATIEKERLESEMRLAQQVQLKNLPTAPPQVPGYEFAAVCRPARQVGGDYYDYFPMADGKIVLMVGDAAGKGLRAAMFVTEVHGLAHAAALESSTPDEMLRRINLAMISARGETSDFVTLFCAILDPASGTLTYASAGHNPPAAIIGGNAILLELGGPPLAIMSDVKYKMHSVSLNTGDTVVIYSDGITEAANADSDLFETDRLTKSLTAGAKLSASELVDAIIADVNDFAAGRDQGDDMTLLVLRRCS